MVTSMGWGFSDFRHLFCFTLLINKACMYHNHIPLMYIFNSPANECWVSFPFKVILYFGLRSKKKRYRPIAFESLGPIIKTALCILFCRGDSVFLIGCP